MQSGGEDGTVSCGAAAGLLVAYTSVSLHRALRSAAAKRQRGGDTGGGAAAGGRALAALLRKTAARAAAVLAAVRWASRAATAPAAAAALSARLAQLQWELEAGCARLFGVVGHLREAVRAPLFDVPHAALVLGPPRLTPQLPAALFFRQTLAESDSPDPAALAALDHAVLEALLGEPEATACAEEVRVEGGRASLGVAGLFALECVPLLFANGFRNVRWAVVAVRLPHLAIGLSRSEALRRAAQHLALGEGGLLAALRFLQTVCGKLRLAQFAEESRALPSHVIITRVGGGETLGARFWGGAVNLHVSENGLQVSLPGEPPRSVRGGETFSEIVSAAIAAQSAKRLRWIAGAAPAGTTIRKTVGGIVLQFGRAASCWARLAVAAETGVLQMHFSPTFGGNVTQRDAALLRLFGSLAFADVAAAHRLLQAKAVLAETLLVAEAGLFEVAGASVPIPPNVSRNAYLLRVPPFAGLLAAVEAASEGLVITALDDSENGWRKTLALPPVDAAAFVALRLPPLLAQRFFANHLRNLAWQFGEHADGSLSATLPATLSPSWLARPILLFPKTVGGKTQLRIRFSLTAGAPPPSERSELRFCQRFSETDFWEADFASVAHFAEWAAPATRVRAAAERLEKTFSKPHISPTVCENLRDLGVPEGLVCRWSFERLSVSWRHDVAGECALHFSANGWRAPKRFFGQCFSEMDSWLAAQRPGQDPAALLGDALAAWPLVAIMQFSPNVGEMFGFGGDVLLVPRASPPGGGADFVLRFGLLFGIRVFSPPFSANVFLKDAHEEAAAVGRLGPRMPLWEWEHFFAYHLRKHANPPATLARSAVGRNTLANCAASPNECVFANDLRNVAAALWRYLAASQAWCYAGEMARNSRYSSVIPPTVGGKGVPAAAESWVLRTRGNAEVILSFDWKAIGVSWSLPAELSALSHLFRPAPSVQALRSLLTLASCPSPLSARLIRLLPANGPVSLELVAPASFFSSSSSSSAVSSAHGLPPLPAPGTPAVLLPDPDRPLVCLVFRRASELLPVAVGPEGLRLWSADPALAARWPEMSRDWFPQ